MERINFCGEWGVSVRPTRGPTVDLARRDVSSGGKIMQVDVTRATRTVDVDVRVFEERGESYWLDFDGV